MYFPPLTFTLLESLCFRLNLDSDSSKSEVNRLNHVLLLYLIPSPAEAPIPHSGFIYYSDSDSSESTESILFYTAVWCFFFTLSFFFYILLESTESNSKVSTSLDPDSDS